jgi:anti-sigma B factor antagonist
MSEVKSANNMVPAVRQEGDTIVASVSGEVDLNNSPVLRGTLLDLINRFSPRKLVLNLSRVPYMDSSAVAVLVECLRKMKGGKVMLAEVQPRVKGLLEIARLGSIFGIVATEADALK